MSKPIVIINGVAFEAESVSIEIAGRPWNPESVAITAGDAAPDWYEPFSPVGSVSFDLTWSFPPDSLFAWLAELESYRALGAILAACRVKPGAVFASLMDVRRN